MTADKLAAAKAGLAELTRSWSAATEAFKSGNVADAVAQATAMKSKATRGPRDSRHAGARRAEGLRAPTGICASPVEVDWEQGRRSDNVEDRRGMGSAGRAGGIGGLGLLLALGIALLLGVNPLALIGMLGGSAVQTPAPPPGAPGSDAPGTPGRSLARGKATIEP
jgi:hypothetical protein